MSLEGKDFLKADLSYELRSIITILGGSLSAKALPKCVATKSKFSSSSLQIKAKANRMQRPELDTPQSKIKERLNRVFSKRLLMKIKSR